MCKQLFLIRHGPTHAKSMVGWSDLPADLSDHARLGYLQHVLPADAPVVSSDLDRARTTAWAIQGSRQRLPDERLLREMNFGAWELQDYTQIKDQDRLNAFWESPGLVKPPGGESWQQLQARVNATVDCLLQFHPKLIAVVHFGVILTQVQRALNLIPAQAFGYRINNLSLTRLSISQDGVWNAEQINQT